MAMLWVHTEAQARFVVVQECADERLKSKTQSHCFFQSLVLGLFPVQYLTVLSLSCPALVHMFPFPLRSPGTLYRGVSEQF